VLPESKTNGSVAKVFFSSGGTHIHKRALSSGSKMRQAYCAYTHLVVCCDHIVAVEQLDSFKRTRPLLFLSQHNQVVRCNAAGRLGIAPQHTKFVYQPSVSTHSTLSRCQNMTATRRPVPIALFEISSSSSSTFLNLEVKKKNNKQQ